MFGINATEDMDMVTQIKSEVRKLCTRNNIAAQIVLNERDQQKEENLARMIYESEKEVKVKCMKYWCVRLICLIIPLYNYLRFKYSSSDSIFLSTYNTYC